MYISDCSMVCIPRPWELFDSTTPKGKYVDLKPSEW